MTPSPSSRNLLPYLLLVIVALSFGGNWVVGRALQQDVAPFAMAFWRWAAALIILAPFALPRVRADRALIAASWKPLALLGAAGIGAFSVFTYWGLKYTAAINGALLNSSMPLFIIPLSWAVLGITVSARQGAGLALSLAGVLTLITRGDAQVLLGLSFNSGDLLILCGMIAWTIYTVYLRFRPAGLHPLSFLFATGLAGTLVCAPFYAFEMLAQGEFARFSLPTLAGIGYLGLFPSVIAFICWNQAVKSVGPNIAGIFLHLVPVTGTLFSMIFLGERLHLYHLAGALLVFAGIVLTSKKQAGVKNPQ